MIDTDERALAAADSLADVARDYLPPDDAHQLIELSQYLRRRLAQPDQSEPVAWCSIEEGDVVALAFKNTGANICDTPLYTNPDRTQAPGEWVLVPREPTRWMVLASNEISCRDEGREHWNAMIAAAPTPPSVPQNGEQP